MCAARVRVLRKGVFVTGQQCKEWGGQWVVWGLADQWEGLGSAGHVGYERGGWRGKQVTRSGEGEGGRGLTGFANPPG